MKRLILLANTLKHGVSCLICVIEYDMSGVDYIRYIQFYSQWMENVEMVPATQKEPLWPRLC